MLKTAQLSLLLLHASVGAVLSQEKAVERTTPADNGMGTVFWIIMAIIFAAAVLWVARSRRSRKL